MMHIETFRGEKYMYLGRYVARYYPGAFCYEEGIWLREISEEQEKQWVFQVSEVQFHSRKCFRVIGLGPGNAIATPLRSRIKNLDRRLVIKTILEYCQGTYSEPDYLQICLGDSFQKFELEVCDILEIKKLPII